MTRDMTQVEYRAALKRNGFRAVRPWWACDTTGLIDPDRMLGVVIDHEGQLLKRESIARLIRERDRLARPEAPR